MKNLWKGSLLALALVTLFPVYASAKEAVVDLEMVLKEAEYAKALNKTIETKFKPRQEGLIKMQKTLQEKARDLKKQQPVLSEKDFKKEQESYQKKRQEFDKKSEAFYRELQESQANASKEFTDLVQKSLTSYAKKHKYRVVWQKPAVAYFDEKAVEDITSKFIKSLPKKK